MNSQRRNSRASRRSGRQTQRERSPSVIPPLILSRSTPEVAHFLRQVASREDRDSLLYKIGIIGFVRACVRFEPVFDYLVPRVDELSMMCSMAFICDLYWNVPSSTFIGDFIRRFQPKNLYVGDLEFLPLPADLLLRFGLTYKSICFNFRFQPIPFFETPIKVDMLEIVQRSGGHIQQVSNSVLASVHSVVNLHIMGGELTTMQLFHLWSYRLRVLSFTDVIVPSYLHDAFGQWLASQGRSLTCLRLDYRRIWSDSNAARRFIHVVCSRLPALHTLNKFELTAGGATMPIARISELPVLRCFMIFVEIHSDIEFWNSLKFVLMSPISVRKAMKFFCGCGSSVATPADLIATVREPFDAIVGLEVDDIIHYIHLDAECP